MAIKQSLSNNKYTKGLYSVLRFSKRKVKKSTREYKCFRWHGTFENRQKGCNKVCIILAGYKEFLYDAIFERLSRFIEGDIDVCIVTSGLYSNEIKKRCEDNNWSYLSTKENNVSLVQNIAIKLHPKAEWIFKIDEDIFITKDFFGNMLRAYNHAELSFYNPGIIAPLIPVNGYGHIRILEKMNAIEDYAEKFEEPKYQTGSNRRIEGDPETAKYMWGKDGMIPSIDMMNEKFKNEVIDERVCAIRFSIGAILFKREFWEEMKYFTVKSGTGMGSDEVQVCQFCSVNNRPIMVSENVVVGHLSFGNQNQEMKEYFLNNPGYFYINEQ